MTITHAQVERLEALLRDRFKAGGATYAFACRDFIDECGQDLLTLARAVLDAPEADVVRHAHIGPMALIESDTLVGQRVRILPSQPGVGE